jgi:LysM repeat protein
VMDDFNFGISQVNACPGGAIGYRVKAGDTLYNIAHLYNTTVTAILSANPGINPNQLEIGGRLCIPAPGPSSCPNGLNYTVQPGDSMYQLSVRFNVTVTAIIIANPGMSPNHLIEGQVIFIPGVSTFFLPQVKAPCCNILESTTALNPPPEIPLLPAGIVFSRQVAAPANVYALLFAANGLPLPSVYGSFDAYLGSIKTQAGYRSAFLALSTPFEQAKTWAGTLLLPIIPQVGDILEISPVNTSTGAKVKAVLRGSLGDSE